MLDYTEKLLNDSYYFLEDHSSYSRKEINSILDFLITKDWYQGGNNQNGEVCVTSSLKESTLLCPECRDDIVECNNCDCELFEDDLHQSPISGDYLCYECYKDETEQPSRKKRKTSGGKRKTRKKRIQNFIY